MDSSVIDDSEALLGAGSWAVFLSEFWAPRTVSCKSEKNLRQEVWAKDVPWSPRAKKNPPKPQPNKKKKEKKNGGIQYGKKTTEWKILGWG